MKKHVQAVKMICVMLATVFALAVAAPPVQLYGPGCEDSCPTIIAPLRNLPTDPDDGDD